MKDIDKMLENKLDLNDKMNFKCKGCGKCCINRTDVLLDSRDLYNIGKNLGRDVSYITNKYCEVYVGQVSMIPLIRIIPDKHTNQCPFLINNKCSINCDKPYICRIFPLGRYSAGENDTHYFHSNSLCGNTTNAYTVKQWLDISNIPVYDEYFLLKSSLIMDMMKKREVFTKASEVYGEKLWAYIATKLYHVDINEDFMTQTKQNFTELKLFVDALAINLESEN